MDVGYHQTKKRTRDGEYLHLDTVRTSRHRTRLEKIFGKELAPSTLIHAHHPNPPIDARIKEDSVGETADAGLQMPTPVFLPNPTMGQVAPNRKRAEYNEDNHLLLSSVVFPTSLFAPSNSEDGADHFYTCPSSPIRNTLERVQALSATPSKVGGRSNEYQHRRPETLIRRKEANWQLRQRTKGLSTKDAVDGFLTDPIPITFPIRQSPTMCKTDFELYLATALSKAESREDSVLSKEGLGRKQK